MRLDRLSQIKTLIALDLASCIFGRVIGLGQGMTYVRDESKVIYQCKDGKENIRRPGMARPASGGIPMSLISESPAVGGIRYYGYYKILKHLGLWERKARPPPKGKRIICRMSHYFRHNADLLIVSAQKGKFLLHTSNGYLDRTL